MGNLSQIVDLFKSNPDAPVPDGWHRFKTSIGDAGYIVSDEYTPILYINGVQIDNKVHQMTRQAVTVIRTTTTTTSGGGK